MPRHHIVWEYVVPREREPEFERAYGPDGAWARLFRRAAGYVDTQLWRDPTRSGRYVTVDVWESASAWEAFRRAHARTYEALDADFAELTDRERLIGRFDAVGEAPLSAPRRRDGWQSFRSSGAAPPAAPGPAD